MEVFARILTRALGLVFLFVAVTIPLFLQWLSWNGPQWVMGNWAGGLGSGTIITAMFIMLVSTTTAAILFSAANPEATKAFMEELAR